MAAADLLMFAGRPGFEHLVCEVHADWLLEISPSNVLVSAKHRDPSQGPWSTVNQLVGAGGIGRLFELWCEHGPDIETKLVTNAPVVKELSALGDLLRASRRASDPKQLLDDEQFRSLIDSICRCLAKHCSKLPSHLSTLVSNSHPVGNPIPDLVRTECVSFLARLTIEDARPQREFSMEAGPGLWAVGYLDRTGLSKDLAVPLWEATVRFVEQRMRGRGESHTSHHVGVVVSQTIDVSKRSISTSDLEQVAALVRNDKLAFAPAPALTRTTKLGVKMQAGGCLDVSIDRAEKLRLRYRRYLRAKREALLESDDGAQELELLALADAASHRVKHDTGALGADLWRKLDETSRSDAARGKTNLDSDLILGGFSDLTQRCFVWFSEPFDVANALAKK